MASHMALSDGDPARGGDVWFRIATRKEHIVRGRVHHSAFGGNAISVPAPIRQRPWTREASGRLRSLAGSLEDIQKNAEAFCAEETVRGGGTKTFSGVLYGRVNQIQLAYENILTTNVHFSPLSRDDAHADFTFHGWFANEADKERFLIWLSDKLQGLHHPGQLHYLPEAEKELRTFRAWWNGAIRTIVAKVRARIGALAN